MDFTCNVHLIVYLLFVHVVVYLIVCVNLFIYLFVLTFLWLSFFAMSLYPCSAFVIIWVIISTIENKLANLYVKIFLIYGGMGN